MGEPLRVLIVEDSESDALLLLAHLKKHDYDLEWERVDDLASMKVALDRKTFDVVIADHSMPRFSAPAALSLIRERGLDVPFIIVSGAIGEETAATAMRAGAHDYVDKDNLLRLVPVIERELRDVTARRDHRRVEEALLESLQTSMETVQAIPSGLLIYQHRPPGRLNLVFGNPEAERLTGIRIEEWLGKDFNEIWPEAHSMGITESFLNVLKTGEILESEELFYRDNRLEGVFRIRAFPMAGNRLGVAFENVTERKRAEEAFARESEVNAAMAELAKMLLKPASIDDVSSTILEYAKRLTASAFGYVGYIDARTGHLVCPTLTKDIWDACQVPNKDIVFDKFSGLWGWVLNNCKPLLANSPSEDLRSTGTPDGHIPIHRFLSVPAMIGDMVVGQVSVANSDRDYSERDLKLIERMAALYAVAIQGKRAYEEIEDRSHKLGEQVKKLNCLYGISQLVEKSGTSLDEILQGTVELIPPSWQYPEITCARVSVEEGGFRTKSCKETPWKLASDINVHGRRVGTLEIYYLEEKPALDEGPFLKEERNLINAVAERLGRIIERTRANDALKEALEESRKRGAETASLLKSARAILELNDLKETEEAIFDACKNLIGATAGYVAILSDDDLNNEVIFLDSGGRSCTVDPNLPMPIRGLRANAYSHGQPVFENNFSDSEWAGFLPEGHVQLENVMFSPLILDSKTVGVIGLANKPGGFTDEDARIAAAFGDHAAIALQNSRNLEALLQSEARYKKLSENLEETVREKLAELRQAESLAAIGRMVSIVAHEVRNPLQNIQMGVDSLRKEIGGDKENLEILGEIDYGIALLNGIIVELLDYSRPVTLQYSDHSVQDLVGHALKALTHKLDGIDVLLEFEEGDKEIPVDAFRIGAVLVNLISNAIEAMPAGGTLKIRSGMSDDNGMAALRLSIIDTGCGISEDNLRRIHEPFFTTKSKGVGLGITVCKKVVEAHNGRLEIASTLNEGTTAQIWLPIETTQPSL